MYIKITLVALTFSFVINSQTLWNKYPLNPVLGNGVSSNWNAQGVYAPSVVKVDSLYKMFYSGFNGINYQIGLAYSSDKVNWTRHFSVPVLEYGSTGSWDARYVMEATVLYENGLYKMWYTGSAGDALELFEIGYAISVNGTNWDKYDFNPVLSASTIGNWDPAGVSSPSIINDNGIYYMWFTGLNLSGSEIGFASSPDGINWNWYQGNPVLTGDPSSWDENVTNCKVLKIGGNFQMWYTGTRGDTLRLGYAYSDDGIDWIKYLGNPVLDIESGTWEQTGVSKPEVLYIEGEYLYMWYSGFDSPIHSQIGFANEITIRINDEPNTIVNQYNLLQNYPNPFNPITKIRFVIPNEVRNLKDFSSQAPRNDNSLITLKVYDVLGNEVATLVNEEKPAGSYEVEFEGGKLTSGIYFYQMRAGNFVETKKMILLK